MIEKIFHTFTDPILAELKREHHAKTDDFRTIKEMKAELINRLRSIVNYQNLLPYPVHVEEITPRNQLNYSQYRLIKINPDGFCLFQKSLTDDPRKGHLDEIFPDHLFKLWQHYVSHNKSGVSVPVPSSDEPLEADFKFKPVHERSAFI
ncbi:MAG: hypothetical protein LUD15_06295 [Bacteroides sp.]|nr:hypothetical protein [Bacteroides sp.]